MCERLFRNILMNGVVGEARERVGDRADFNFGLVRLAQFENSLRDAARGSAFRYAALLEPQMISAGGFGMFFVGIISRRRLRL